MISAIFHFIPTHAHSLVGLASQRSHSIYRRSRGMYFSSQDRGAMSAMVYNWPHDEVDVIVVTDGSRVLGLGDLGANGMQVIYFIET